ncbi:MMPL family transporter [Streptomyces sp. Ru87]|uniref:MMPL family transporter n=1 Tax=Streptomyces sp. Ru87 TaxID=2044307 RepID=UPI0015D50F5C|nr:MMPL family transporter [Streptomyces sp. Ru87]
MAALARWCLRHRWVVLWLWLGVLGGTVAGSVAAGSSYTNVFGLEGTGSSRAIELMEDAFPERAGDTDTVVWETSGGTVRDAEVRGRMEAALADIAKLPDVGSVASPYEPGGAARISENGRIAYAEVTFAAQAFELDPANTERVIDRAREAAGEGLRVELGGQAIEQTQQPPAGLAEAVGVLAAAVVLFLAFGSFYAMLLPLLNALFAVGTGMAGIVLLSHVTGIPDVAPLLGSLIGLGVGIDYALFVVTRHRKGLAAGLDPWDAAVRALDTSGRAVLFAGGTVCVALLAMFTLDLAFLNGIAIATTLTVVLSVLAAATLLPAMLGFLGPRVLSRRERRAAAAGTAAPPAPGVTGAREGTGVRWSRFLERHPKAPAAVAVLLMAALALPVFSLRLGINDQGNQPAAQTTRQAYDLLAEGFGPGFNGPLQLVAETSGAPADRAALDGLVTEVRALPGVARVTPLPVPPGTDTAVVQVVPETSPQSEETDRLIDRLREEVVPDSEAGTELRVHVGGATAVQKDFASVIGDRLPAFIALIVGLGAVLLLLAFRSVVVPLTAAVMNLLAAAASFGILVAVFQWGWGTELLGLGKEGPVIAFLPVIMLPLLFGLSMDYQVFLVSRMHEEWTHTKDNARAVRVGLAETSRVINCAALIMICVFASFVLSGDRGAVMAGLGLAGAVALDAFILRTILVPALMHLIGRANWWLPRPLDRVLPHLAVDPPEEPVRPGGGPGAAGPGAAGPGVAGPGGTGADRPGPGAPRGGEDAGDGDTVLVGAGPGDGGPPR